MNVRRARRDDLPGLEHLHTERAALLLETDPRLQQRPMPAWLEHSLAITWVGELDGRLIGFLTLSPVDGFPNTVLIEAMALDVHQAVPGLGRKLLAAAREWAVSHGAARMLVLVPRYSPVEQAFWRASGARNAPDYVSPDGYDGLEISL